MALRFISHREIAFRQLLGMLRTPPIAVMSYYTNLFLSARFVFGEQPDKIKHLDREIRKVECKVGVQRTHESDQIQKELYQISLLKKDFESQRLRLEELHEMSDDNKKKDVERIYKEMSEQMDEIDRKEYALLLRLTPLMNLKMMETYMDNNLDLKSYFNEGGKIVTQMELGSDLEKIKIWVYQEAVEMMPYIRFTKLE